MTESSTPPLRHRWRDRVKSAAGPDDPMLRLVLLVLGDWSPVEGGTFMVKNSTLSQQTGLGDRSLRDRLKQAEGVWFVRERRSRGRPYRYRLKIPTAIDAARPLEDIRNRSNGPWRDDVDNSAGCGTTAPDPDDEGAAPPRRTSGTTAPDQCGTPAPAIDVPIRKKDVARERARPVESLAAHVPDPEDELQVSPPQSRSENAPPSDEGDDQLEIAHFILEAIKGGNHEDFDAATEMLSERKRQERQQRSSGGSG